ncbi:MAG: flavin reductase family protein [Gammaproteobacteria bacterium]
MGDVTDQRALRNTLGAFATGVTVVTTTDEAQAPWGFTANSFTSVSLDPPLILFCLAKNAGSLATFQNASHYAINILADDQRDTSTLFASGDRNKFDLVSWDSAKSGSPVLEGVAAWLDCAAHQTVDGGDHLIFIGRITDFWSRNVAPLGYCRGAYVPLALDHRMFQATQAGNNLSVSVIVEHDWSVLLREDPKTGELSLPTAPNLGDEKTPGSLLQQLAQRGIHQPALFVFSISDEGDEQRVIYRTEIVAPPTFDGADDLAFHNVDKIDWERIGDEAIRRTLVRYARERAEDSFGVVVGDERSGFRQALR